MTRSSAPRRDFAAMQERRRRAARLFAAGKRSQAEIARELDISRQSVSRWFEAWRQDNPDWIRGAGRAGRRPKLDEAQLKQVDEALRQGAQAHGFGTNLWTLPRVAAVIERATGIHYHPGHVWKILAALEWSLQRPAKRARERNDEGRRLWMAANRDAAGVFSGLESGRGFMEQHQRTGTGQPLCCWTWRGRRPCSQRHGSRAPIQAAVFFPTPRGTLFLTNCVTLLCDVQQRFLGKPHNNRH